MKFHALVEVIDCVERTTTTSSTGKVSKKVWLVVRDIDTDRTHWIEDRSGIIGNAWAMGACGGSVLEVRGFVECLKRINFLVLEKWGIWDPEQRKVFLPDTKEDGYISIAKDELNLSTAEE